MKRSSKEVEMRHLAFEKFMGSTSIGIVLLLSAAQYARAANSPSTPPTIKQELTETVGSRIKLGDNQDGALLFKSETSGQYIKAPMVKTDVVMDIAGPIIRTTLSQTFENTSDQWVEGIYVFPLPENAAVDHLRMVIGGRLIEGQIKEKVEAKKIYEQAKAEGKKASLVEQERPNIFTASVANIGPHEKVAIQIEYQDKAAIKFGVFSTRFPMTVAPRYSLGPKTFKVASNSGETVMAVLDPVLDRARITPPLMNPADEPSEYIRLPVTMQVNLDAGFPIANIDSPYHNISIVEIDEDSARISFADGPVPANKDFLLEWKAQPATKPYSAVFKQEIGDETYLLTMLTPPKPIIEELETHARESIYVVDTSGSMGGGSIEQAKASLMMALDHLEPGDTFNIIRFSSDHSTLFSVPKLATEQNISKAKRFVRALSADGGTEMAPALKEALAPTSTESGRVRQILFITDGAIGNEQMLFSIIKDNLKNSRLFLVAIGSAPNSFFMSRAAKFGRGTFVQIGDLSEVKNRMGSLFTSLDNPVLTNLKSNLEGSGETYPARLPDLYEGDPIITIAKMPTTKIPQNLYIEGKLASQPWKTAHRMKSATKANGLSVLWARQKIADLEESRFDRQTAAEIDGKILQTALDHHIVSRLTSLVAVDITPSRPIGDQLVQSQVPTQLPDGWDFGKLAGIPAPLQSAAQFAPAPMAPQSQPSLALPSTASPHTFLTLLGLFLMSFGMMWTRRRALIRAK
jgi:Ca-activated chloride channel family protein